MKVKNKRNAIVGVVRDFSSPVISKLDFFVICAKWLTRSPAVGCTQPSSLHFSRIIFNLIISGGERGGRSVGKKKTLCA